MGIKYSELPKTSAPTNDDYVAILDNETATLKTTSLQNAVDSTLGTADISALGDGTVKGAIVAAASSGGGGSEVVLTQAEYDALPDSKYTDGVTYFITDSGDAGKAAGVAVDTIAGLSATNVQEALVEINSNLTADGTPFRFGKDSEGKFGYILTDETGADSVVPFKSGEILKYDCIGIGAYSSNQTQSLSWTATDDCIIFAIMYVDSTDGGASGSLTINGTSVNLSKSNYSNGFNFYKAGIAEMKKGDTLNMSIHTNSNGYGFTLGGGGGHMGYCAFSN